MYALPTAAADVVLSAHLKLAYELILCVYSNCLADSRSIMQYLFVISQSSHSQPYWLVQARCRHTSRLAQQSNPATRAAFSA